MQTQSIKFERRNSETCVPKAFFGELKCFWCDIEDSCKNRLISFVNKKQTIQDLIYGTFLTYLYRINNSEPFSLKFLIKEKFSISRCFQTTIDFLSADMSFEDAIKIALKKKQQLLSADNRNHHDITVSGMKVSIHLLDEFDEYNTSYERGLNILIDRNGNAVIAITSDDAKNECLYSFAKNLPARIKYFLEVACLKIEKLVQELPLVTHLEFEKICYEWNDTKAKYPRDSSLIELFMEQTIRMPNKIAVICREKMLTYNELNEKSNQLACLLKNRGIRHGDFVALYMKRNLNMLIGLIGILKTSAAYVPVDPDYPTERVKHILKNNLIKCCIVDSSSTKDEKKEHFIQVLDLRIIDITELEKKQDKTSDLTLNTNAEDVAYVMFTSGSTGAPKGVTITHRGIIRLVKNTNYITIKSDDCIAQSSNCSFDASTLEIWGALLNGAKLAIVSKEEQLTPNLFEEFLRKHKITILYLGASLFTGLVKIKASIFHSIETLIVGGEPLNSCIVTQLLRDETAKPKRLINGYGPTENTTFTTCYEINEVKTASKFIWIGKPISNTQVYVLDRWKQLLPVGVIGELYISGDGLSKGYLQDDKLTGEKFTRNPFDRGWNTKLYQTGDLVRWLPNGNLEFMKRTDDQLKIRSFRVEPGEIEYHINKFSSVWQSAVIAKEHRNGRKQLIAFLVRKNDSSAINKDDLFQYLKKVLPDYMLPKIFVEMDFLPVTCHGKIDHLALQKHKITKEKRNKDKLDFRGKIEKTLVDIWCKVLSLDFVGPEDDFFCLGGDSILVTQVILSVKNHFGVDINFQKFIESPTIFALSHLIESKKANTSISNINVMAKDAKLSSVIVVSKDLKTSWVPPKAILITGATGFLGVHLLNDLHLLSDSKIYCLIRGKNKEEAQYRLNKSILNFSYFKNLPYSDRIIPVVGDLSQPNFGMNEMLYNELSREIDVIYHCGANTSHIYSYEVLKPSNVFGSVEIIKFAVHSKLKQINYISTLSFSTGKVNNTIGEEFTRFDTSRKIINGGYSQTKWIAEILFSQACRRGVPIKIFRPGWIMDDSLTGTFPAEKNHLLRVIQGCCQMGVAPRWETFLNLLPVNFVSCLIARASLSNKINHKIFNLKNSNLFSWSQLIKWIESNGIPIKLISPQLWYSRYLPFIGAENSLFPLSSIYLNLKNKHEISSIDTVFNVQSNNFNNAAHILNLRVPTINKLLLKKIFSMHLSSFVRFNDEKKQQMESSLYCIRK